MLQARRKEIWDAYQNEFRHVNWIENPVDAENGDRHSYFTYCIRVRNRDKLAKYLLSKEIYTTLRYHPLHMNKIYNQEKITIEKIEKEFKVEKELLLALMGIETNFGKYLGKMDIVSSLATLSYDKRRSAFFTEELLILLKLVDSNIINKDILYGSWAGAFGNFQFMPSTIKKYAIDFNNDNKIELKNLEDSFASAANYINRIGWKKDQPCYLKVNLSDNIPNKYLNTSAKKIKNKKNFIFDRRP